MDSAREAGIPKGEAVEKDKRRGKDRQEWSTKTEKKKDECELRQREIETG
jgi:hypothetical protein